MTMSLRKGFQKVQFATLRLAATALMILLGGVGSVHAGEHGALKGRVLDAVTRSGIAGARVYIEGSEATTFTDSGGDFILARRPGPGEGLVVKAVGYETLVVKEALTRTEPGGHLEIQLHAAPSTFREHVVVTATRTPTRVSDVPGNVSILDRRDLATTPTSNLVDALAVTPGVQSYSPWGNPQDFGLNVRGFTGGGFSDYFVVLVDGVQINDVDSGLVDWNILPVDRIDRVEVQRGPASALYGDTGLGGVIHLFTDATESGPATSVSMAGGDHGEKQTNFLHAGDSEKLRYSISGSHRETTGFRDRSEWDSDGLTARFQIPLGNRSDLNLSTANHWLDNQSPGPLSEAQIKQERTQASYPFDGWEQSRSLFAADFTHRWVGGATLTAGLSHRVKDSEQILTLPLELQFGNVLTPAFDTKQQVLDARTTTLQSQVNRPVEYGGARHHFLVGIEASDSDLDSRYRLVDLNGDPGALVADGSGTRTVVALYLQDQIAEVGPLSFSAGVRYDMFEDEFTENVAAAGNPSSSNDAISPKLGMTWAYRSDGDLFVQASRGFRAPTLEQLFDQRSPFGAGLSNSDLEPLKSTNYEIGIHQSFSRHADLEVAFYLMRLRNEIEFDPATFQFNNIGHSRHRGAELSFTGHVKPKLGAFLTYTFQDATHESGSAAGNQIIFVPRHLGSLGVRYGAESGWLGSMVLRVVGRQFLDESNLVPIESYSTLDAQVGYQWKHIEVHVAGMNLLDREYATNGFITPRSVVSPGPALPPTIMEYPAPLRAYRAGLRWRF